MDFKKEIKNEFGLHSRWEFIRWHFVTDKKDNLVFAPWRYFRDNGLHFSKKEWESFDLICKRYIHRLRVMRSK